MAGYKCISIGTIQKYLANPEKKFQNRHLLDKLKTLPNREINFKFGLIHRSTNNSLPFMWNFKETRTEKCVASDERSAFEHYFERGFRYDTIAQFFEKEVMRGLRFYV